MGKRGKRGKEGEEGEEAGTSADMVVHVGRELTYTGAH